MYAKPPKKLLIMNILDILRKYTDENHRLGQNEIVEILEREYSMKTDRKSVKRNLMDLIEFGYDINYSDSLRMYTNRKGEQEESHILSDFYLNHEFTDSELRLLVDSVMFSPHIPPKQSEQLVEKLRGLSNIYFASSVRHITKPPTAKTDNQQIFYNIELLDEAIHKGVKVRFQYAEYRTDKRLHRRRRSDGSVRTYFISPYQMAAKEGKYYLICNYERFDTIVNYRIDRIFNLELLDEPVKPFEKLHGSGGKRLNLEEYMRKHVYMFSSDDVRAVFRIEKALLSDVIDLFGKNVTFSDETVTHVTVTANINEMSMEQFAKSFSSKVTILKPATLAARVQTDLENALSHYR